MEHLAKYWGIYATLLAVAVAAGGIQSKVGANEQMILAQADSQETLEQRTTMIAAGVQQLQEIHVAMDAEEKAREEQRIEFCRAGKLDESECRGVEE